MSKLLEVEKSVKQGSARMALLVPKSIRGYDIDKQISMFAVEAAKNPKLLDCHPDSIRIAFYHAAAMGLEVGSGLGHGYLVPRKGVCTFMPGFRGLIYSAMRSGAVQQVWAETVHANDQFSYRIGTDPAITHVPAVGDRGEFLAAYAVARLPNGCVQFVVLDSDEIQRIRSASASSDSGPWVAWFEEMAKKSAIRRLVKQLPVSTDDQRATFLRTIEADGLIDAGVSTDQVGMALGVETPKQLDPAKPAPLAIDVAIGHEPAEPAPSSSGAPIDPADLSLPEPPAEQPTMSRADALAALAPFVKAKSALFDQIMRNALLENKVQKLGDLTTDKLVAVLGRLQSTKEGKQ